MGEGFEREEGGCLFWALLANRRVGNTLPVSVKGTQLPDVGDKELRSNHLTRFRSSALKTVTGS